MVFCQTKTANGELTTNLLKMLCLKSFLNGDYDSVIKWYEFQKPGKNIGQFRQPKDICLHFNVQYCTVK